MNETQPMDGIHSMNEAQFITIPIAEYQRLIESIREISNLRNEVQELRKKVTTLEKDRDNQAENQFIQLQLINRLKEEVHKQAEPDTPTGKDTLTRIAQLKAILKKNGGFRTFKQLQADMNLSQSQFSKLVRKLDRRVFDVRDRPHSRGEKVLFLRERIKEF